MDIAIHCAELDAARVDGTRVYLSEVLKRLGALAPEVRFHLFHRGEWNPELAPPHFPNYIEHVLPEGRHWTQTRFTRAIRALRPEVVWMPIQTVPFGLPKSTKVVVTAHDLAFEVYPETFPWQDRWRHRLFSRFALWRADRVIAITEATKRDIGRLMPGVDVQKISVVHHGFDGRRFAPGLNENDRIVLERFQLEPNSYILYVGALQPRKNLVRLLEAFALAKREVPEMKLALVGARAWLWESIERAARQHDFHEDIILTGAVNAEDLPSWYRGARVFVYPSLYEGFGIPLLEAFASGVPVLTANNSSLSEVGGEAPRYASATDVPEIARQLVTLWRDEAVRRRCIERGLLRAQDFSWDRCAAETLAVLRG